MAFSLGEVFQQTAAANFFFNSMTLSSAQRRAEVCKPCVSLNATVGLVKSSSFGISSVQAHQNYGWSKRPLDLEFGAQMGDGKASGRSSLVAVRAGPESATPVKPSGHKKKYPGEAKGFVEEMRFVAMKLHTKDQSKEGEKEDANVQPVQKWQPTMEGYLKFLVNSKLVFETLEEIVATAAHPSYAEFRNTGLERSARLAKDLEWFKSKGHEIPDAGEEGLKYAELLKGLSETDPPAFICHFYNVYFAHSAGGKFIGKKVADSLINGEVLEFYKWDGDLQTLLMEVKAKLNAVAEGWTREEKNHCLEETELSFKYSGKLLRLIIS